MTRSRSTHSASLRRRFFTSEEDNMDRIRNEPALIVGLVQALLALALAFGVELTQAQVGSVLAVTAALLSVVVRQQVTPYVDDQHEVTPEDV